MKAFFQFVAVAILLNYVADVVGNVFGLHEETEGSQKLIIALTLWWGAIVGIVFAWLVYRKRQKQEC